MVVNQKGEMVVTEGGIPMVSFFTTDLMENDFDHLAQVALVRDSLSFLGG